MTDAPLAPTKRPFPVFVYQPGGGTARFIATFQAEQLASRGCVIVSADHAGFSETALFPDGYRFLADTMLAPKETGHFRDDVLNNLGWLERDVFPTWTADASYTLDKIAELDPHRAHDIIIAYTLAFFDKYLRGGRGDLLKAPSAEYPEVTFRKKDGQKP